MLQKHYHFSKRFLDKQITSVLTECKPTRKNYGTLLPGKHYEKVHVHRVNALFSLPEDFMTTDCYFLVYPVALFVNIGQWQYRKPKYTSSSEKIAKESIFFKSYIAIKIASSTYIIGEVQ